MAPKRIRVKVRFSKFLTFFLLFTLLVISININPSKNIGEGINSFARIWVMNKEYFYMFIYLLVA